MPRAPNPVRALGDIFPAIGGKMLPKTSAEHEGPHRQRAVDDPDVAEPAVEAQDRAAGRPVVAVEREKDLVVPGDQSFPQPAPVRGQLGGTGAVGVDASANTSQSRPAARNRCHGT